MMLAMTLKFWRLGRLKGFSSEGVDSETSKGIFILRAGFFFPLVREPVRRPTLASQAPASGAPSADRRVCRLAARLRGVEQEG